MQKKILVLGSNSFSGSQFSKTALEAGYSVLGVSRSPEPNAVFLPYKNLSQGDFKFFQLDVNKNLPEIAGLLKKEKPNYVVNFSAQSMVGESWSHPNHWYQTNVVSMARLQESLRHCDFLEKYIHFTTPEVYGSCEGKVEENWNFNPSTPYAVSRAANDWHLKCEFENYGFPVVFTRAANVYGPHQQLYRIIPRTILYFLTGKKLQLHGGGYSDRSFIHMDDVSLGLLRILEMGAAGETFHFSTTEQISIRQLVKNIAEKLGVDFNQLVESVGERAGKDKSYFLDSQKAERLLNWRPEINLETGLAETVSWVKSNLETLLKQPQGYVHKE